MFVVLAGFVVVTDVIAMSSSVFWQSSSGNCWGYWGPQTACTIPQSPTISPVAPACPAIASLWRAARAFMVLGLIAALAMFGAGYLNWTRHVGSFTWKVGVLAGGVATCALHMLAVVMLTLIYRQRACGTSFSRGGWTAYSGYFFTGAAFALSSAATAWYFAVRFKMDEDEFGDDVGEVASDEPKKLGDGGDETKLTTNSAALKGGLLLLYSFYRASTSFSFSLLTF